MDQCELNTLRIIPLLTIAGLGIEETNTGISIPAVSIISFQYRTKKMPNCICLVWYRLGPGIVSFIHSCTRLIGCQRVRQLYTHTCTHTPMHTYKHTHTDMDKRLDIDIYTQHGHESAALKWKFACTVPAKSLGRSYTNSMKRATNSGKSV